MEENNSGNKEFEDFEEPPVKTKKQKIENKKETPITIENINEQHITNKVQLNVAAFLALLDKNKHKK